MEHFYENIHGWFSYDYVYRDVVEQAEDGDLFVEIGSFKGKSTSFMCVEIVNSGKKIRFDCIDPMKTLSHYAESAKNDPEEWADYHQEGFHERLTPVKGVYNLNVMTSDEAVSLYEDGSIDFLLVDGDHTYEGCKRDIENFIPKMRSGGLIVCDDAWAPDIANAARDAVPEGVEVQFNGLHAFIQIP
jgi:predicted O-methyltransferase YrrM